MTSGMDGMMKVWDIRTYKALHGHRLHRAAHALSISQKGQLAVGFGPNVYVRLFMYLNIRSLQFFALSLRSTSLILTHVNSQLD